MYKNPCDYWEILTIMLFATKHWIIARENLAQKEYGFVFSNSLQLDKQVCLINSTFKKPIFPILWEILTASQKLLDRNVLWKDLKSNQSSKANIILATSETTRGAWGKKMVFLVFGFCFPPCGWTSSFSLRSNQRWESLRTPRCGGWKMSLYSQEVALILLIPFQPP